MRSVAKHSFFPEDPAGLLTVGALFSEHLTGGYIDTVTGLYATQDRNSFLFLDSRYHYEDNTQFLDETGLGFRQRLPGRDVILGVNGFYDSLRTQNDHEIKQLGLGAEILTRWIDARFNYYRPEDDRFETGRFRTREVFNLPGGVLTQTRSLKTYEQGLEGFNAEIGFLIPGLDRYAEVRLLGGYYRYDNPFGSPYEGFKGRLEARLLPGLIADLEYWDDAKLMGGHWTAGVRASVPFSLVNLVRGRNPFEDAGEYFKPRGRDFQERMSEMVIRSHRVQTANSGPVQTGEQVSFQANPPAPPAGVAQGVAVQGAGRPYFTGEAGGTLLTGGATFTIITGNIGTWGATFTINPGNIGNGGGLVKAGTGTGAVPSPPFGGTLVINPGTNLPGASGGILLLGGSNPGIPPGALTVPAGAILH